MNVFTHLIDRLRHGRSPDADAAASAALAGDGLTGSMPVPGAASVSGLTAPERRPENRIIAGRLEFTNQFAHLAQGKRNWQIAAFMSLGLLIVVTGAYIHLASTSRITPYVVEVDALGQARAFGPAEKQLAVDDRLTIHQLSLFVRNIRTVYRDPLAQKDMIVRAYAFADAGAQEWLNGYFRDPENDPRLLARHLSRRVEVKSVIRVPDSESWKVSWVEVETPAGTTTKRRSAWEGYLTVRQVPPASTATIDYNPLGLYITALNWTQVSRG